MRCSAGPGPAAVASHVCRSGSNFRCLLLQNFDVLRTVYLVVLSVMHPRRLAAVPPVATHRLLSAHSTDVSEYLAKVI